VSSAGDRNLVSKASIKVALRSVEKDVVLRCGFSSSSVSS
jgi:hypothetical protein